MLVGLEREELTGRAILGLVSPTASHGVSLIGGMHVQQVPGARCSVGVVAEPIRPEPWIVSEVIDERPW